MKQLLTTDDVAMILQVPKSTLYAWRYQGIGPAAIRIGRHLRYRARDVAAWVSDSESNEQAAR